MECLYAINTLSNAYYKDIGINVSFPVTCANLDQFFIFCLDDTLLQIFMRYNSNEFELEYN